MTGADGGEDAHTFFFYGFPGTGKTYIAELVSRAIHGDSASEHFARFSMQNYKTDEDMWKLVSPPCGVKGEGAFAALFASRARCGDAPARHSWAAATAPALRWCCLMRSRRRAPTS